MGWGGPPPCLKIRKGLGWGRKGGGFTHLLCSHGVDGDSSAGFVVMVWGGEREREREGEERSSQLLL